MTLRNFADTPGLPKEIENTFKTGIEIDLNLSALELTLKLLCFQKFSNESLSLWYCEKSSRINMHN